MTKPLILHSSVIGNTHIRKKLPNQDSADSWISPKGDAWIAVIADGHGSSGHPYSDIGSKLATKITVNNYQSFYNNSTSTNTIGVDLINFKHDFFLKILNEWRRDCMLDYESKHPQGTSKKAELLSDSQILRLYGSTICYVYKLSDSIIISTLGDSSVFVRNESGLISHLLFNDESPGESTNSLCQKNPEVDIEHQIIFDSNNFILISTDGIIKSLDNTNEFHKIADYYYKLISSSSSDSKIINDLNEQLDYFSKNGSGDDCTALLIYQGLSTIDSLKTKPESFITNPSVSFEPTLTRQKKTIIIGLSLLLLLLILTIPLLIFQLTAISKPRILNLMKEMGTSKLARKICQK